MLFTSSKVSSTVKSILMETRNSEAGDAPIHMAIEELEELFHCRSSVVLALDGTGSRLEITHQRGLSWTFCNGYSLSITSLLSGPARTLWEGQIVHVTNAAEHPDLAATIQMGAPFGSCLVFPIVVLKRQVGFVFLDDPKPNHFAEKNLPMAEVLVELIAFNLFKARSMAELEKLDLRDKETSLKKHQALCDQVSLELMRAERFSDSLTLLRVEIVNLSEIASTGGDLLARGMFRRVCQVLQKSFRQIDDIARCGNNGVLLALYKTDSNGARVCLEKVTKLVQENGFSEDNFKAEVLAVAKTYPQDGRDLDTLLDGLKTAMNQAKRERSANASE